MPRRNQPRRSLTPTTNTIAFRAPTELLALIDDAAKKLNMTRGELVRAIVATHLLSQPTAIAEDLAKLLAKTSLAQRNQARLLVTLLTTIGEVPLEQAKEIARTTLLS
jgi:formate-dependent nitrite reductase cytochrome c552 subunit